jgi:hypothetical protein
MRTESTSLGATLAASFANFRSEIKPRLVVVALALALAIGLGVVWTPEAHAQTLKMLYDFRRGNGGQEEPQGLAIDSARNLYGTAPGGTNSGGGLHQHGTIVELTASGAEPFYKVLHNFCVKKNCSDGSVPFGNLALNTETGILYGSTAGGTKTCGKTTCGDVFQISTGGTNYKAVYNFAEPPADAAGANGRFNSRRSWKPVWHKPDWRRWYGWFVGRSRGNGI